MIKLLHLFQTSGVLAAGNTYDLAVDTFEDLEFVGTAKVKRF